MAAAESSQLPPQRREGCRVNALPIHASAFSVSAVVLDTRTIPESFLFLKDVPKIPFEELTGDITGKTARAA